MTADEFIEWFEDHPKFPAAPRTEMLYEMEAEGITFEIRNGAPFINTDKWVPLGDEQHRPFDADESSSHRLSGHRGYMS